MGGARSSKNIIVIEDHSLVIESLSIKIISGYSNKNRMLLVVKCKSVLTHLKTRTDAARACF